MPRVPRVLLAAAVAVGVSGACSNSSDDDAAKPGRPTADTKGEGSATPVGDNPDQGPADCRKLNVDELSRQAGRTVQLHGPRSTEASQGTTRGIRCTFVEQGKSNETGSITYTVHASVDDAVKAYDEGLAGARRFTLPIVVQARGDASYAVDLAGTWSCSIRVGARVSTASLAADAADKACVWADEALKTFSA